MKMTTAWHAAVRMMVKEINMLQIIRRSIQIRLSPNEQLSDLFFLFGRSSPPVWPQQFHGLRGGAHDERMDGWI